MAETLKGYCTLMLDVLKSAFIPLEVASVE